LRRLEHECALRAERDSDWRPGLSPWVGQCLRSSPPANSAATMIAFGVDEVNRARANMEGTYLFSRSSNHDAWETNDLFPTDGRIADFSLALYDCLSACQSKGRNSAASGTSVSLRLPINVNATVSISYLLSLLIPFVLTSSVAWPLSIIIISYVLSRKLMFHWPRYFRA
jgi:hypothetical protein